MTFEQMQGSYQWIRQTWMTQPDSVKQQMLKQLQEISRTLLPGERGFMLHLHALERKIQLALSQSNA
ncbi:MAG: hypothetical protein ABI384_00160 [Allobranchiibius sp.]|jgi:hypothetical protein